MEAKELRIGNLFNPLVPTKVEAWMLMDDSKMAFKPIPLTEQWLLNFGFKKFREHEIYSMNGDFQIGKTMPEQNERGYWFFIGASNNEDTPYSVNITHVHQLQNLYFALVKKELKRL